MKSKINSGKFTESRFTQWTKTQNFFTHRVNDCIGNVQPADYLLIFKNNYVWVEVKEVAYDSHYPIKRTTQEQLLIVMKSINTQTKSCILIHFKSFNLIACLLIDDYITIKNNSAVKSMIKLKDIPKRHLYTWADLYKFFNQFKPEIPK